MDKKKVNLYEACDSAIRVMNRLIVEDFGRLKLTKWDDVNIIQTVRKVYQSETRNARKRYYEVAFEAFVLAMLFCGEGVDSAHAEADKAVTNEWINEILDRPDPVTKYAFNPEADRKAYRLAEALEVSTAKSKEIDRAERDWSRQLGQYALIFTDEAMLAAYKRCGIEKIMWYSEGDEKSCASCDSYHGRVFEIDKVPMKPHYGCRCKFLPVIKEE